MKKSSSVARNSAKASVTPSIQSAYSIDPCCAANRIELFARAPRTGWDAFGNQSAGTVVTMTGENSANDEVMRVAAKGSK